MKYKTKFKGKEITGTYSELTKIIANSGFMSIYRIEKDV